MVLFNFIEQTKDISTVSRYNGGWLKIVSGLDKSQTDGYSIEGQFVKAGNYKMEYSHGLYLDCSKDGSRKNQVWNYHLFRVDDDGFHLLQTLEDGGRNWACEFWEKIDEEMNGDTVSSRGANSRSIINMIYEKTRDGVVLGEVVDKLRDDLCLDEQYRLCGTIDRYASKSDFEGFLKVCGLKKVESVELNRFEEEATALALDWWGEQLSEEDFEHTVFNVKLLLFVGADRDYSRINLDGRWFEDIGRFGVDGYFYETTDGDVVEYVLWTANKPLKKVYFANVVGFPVL